MRDGSDPLISFRGVQKTYDGETLVVKDLTIDVRRGEFLTLLGPSGSGKTTCLMMLAGFETPTSGEILLDGKVINRVPPHKRNIGMVFQNYALFPHMTVAENVAFPLTARKLQGERRSSRRLKRRWTWCEWQVFGGRYPEQLSGGQQQRIALARALVFEPSLVLMDEPLGALDKQLREHMQLEIRHIHERLGVTIVYVTHDQGEALTMSDRIAVFNHGHYSADAMADEALRGAGKRLRCQLYRREQCACRARRAEQAGAAARSGSRTAAASRRGCGDVGAPGSPATLSIRPERVHLNGASTGSENRFSAAIEELIYLGDHVRIRMQVANNANFMAKIPISELHGKLRPGDTMTIGVPADHIRAFAPASG